MSNVSTKWILELVDKITSPMKEVFSNTLKTKKGIEDLDESIDDLGYTAVNINAIADSFRALNERLNSAIEPGVRFQDGLADVQAITGVADEALEQLGLKARKSAKIFGGEASQSLDTYKTILSRLGPDLAKNQDALGFMENQVRTLSKTMGGDTVSATDALTTSLLQFKVDLKDPIAAAKEMDIMMNIMAAGAKEGTAEVTDISAGLKVAGVNAEQSNVTFAETNSALQELARGGKTGAEAGIGLRNVLAKMKGIDVIPKEAADKLKALGIDYNIVSDTSLTFTDRLRELKKAQADATLISQIFGLENAAAASILLDSVDAQDELTIKIQGTNVAYEQAEIKMNTFSEKMSRLKAIGSDIGISIFNASESFIPFVNGGFKTIDMVADLSNAKKGLTMVMDSKLGIALSNSTKGIKKMAVAIKSSLMGGLKKASKQMLLFAKRTALAGWNALKSAGKFVFAAVTGLGSFVVGLIGAATAQWGLNTAMLANPVGLFVVGIAAIIGAIALAIVYWDDIIAAIKKMAIWIIDLIDNVFPGFKDIVKSVLESVGGFIDVVLEKFGKIWEWIKKFLGIGDEKIEVDAVVNYEEPTAEDYHNALYVDKEKGIGTDPLGLNKKKNQTEKKEPKGTNDTSINGTGTGGNKSMVQNLTVNNHFKVDSDTDVESLVQKITRLINDNLQDGMLAIG